jgi:unsaturated chondroitin disaccharide hydrolase
MPRSWKTRRPSVSPVVRVLAIVLIALPISMTLTGQHRVAEPPVTLAADEAPCSSTASRSGLDQQLRQVVELELRKLASADVPPFNSYPHDAAPSATSWSRAGAGAWTSGFYPGALWQAYELTGDPAWRARAERWTPGIAPLATSKLHDLGFMIFDSFGQGVRLAGHPDYVATIRTASGSLDKHYDPVIKANWSWSPDPFNVIIDSAMNLELLFWTGRRDNNVRFLTHAHDHALTLLAQHVRPDGSTFHVVDFDRGTGLATRRYTVQGYQDASTWSRGQAWALYGLTEAWRSTGDPALHEAATRVASWWVSHVPTGCVPFVDFDAPPGPGQVRDSSAAAIAASGLLELVRLDPNSPAAPAYRDAAVATIDALTRSPYLSTNPSHPSLLLHQSPHWAPRGIDTSFIWGDYYVLEAIARMRDLPRTDLQQWPVGTVQASSSDTNRPQGAVDGSLATRWSALGDGQWLQLDLGSARPVSAVRVAQLAGDRRSSRFDILGSVDGRTWAKLLGATSSGHTLATQDFSFSPELVRYVRYVGHGNTESGWNSVTEFAAFGQPGVLPSAVRVSVDRTNLVAGHPLVVGLRVVNAATNVGVAGVPVQLWQTVNGVSWYQTENRITDSAGLVRVTRSPTVPVTYQARFPGTNDWSPSSSGTAHVTVTR